MRRRPIRRALVSVYDKSGLLELGKRLHDAKVEILSTGSTAQVLMEAGIPVTRVEDYTGSPEMLGGRVKTLHPRVHAGILADSRNDEHMKQLKDAEIEPIDLVVINLYPFESTVASGATFDESIEQIDIGGPSMLRGAAKNHASVAVISSTSQYQRLFTALAAGGFTDEERQALALETFQRTSEYDASIATWLSGGRYRAEQWELIGALRYGENPHQKASLFSSRKERGIAQAVKIHGKEMSFNNYIDGDAAIRAAYDHQQPCVAIIKHTNPCGIAVGESIGAAYVKAHACDPVSAFGGVVAANREITSEMASALSEVFTEVVIAPSYESGAVEILSKKPSLRILTVEGKSTALEELRPISGGLLIQEIDRIDENGDDAKNWTQVSGDLVSEKCLADLEFAWRSVRAVKSNAILLAKDGASVGVGMGQVNRVDSARLAVARAGERVSGSVAASDAFFPFPDGLQILIDAGVIAVVAPGGSVRDDEVIAAAKAANIPMFFTGVRHFSHS